MLHIRTRPGGPSHLKIHLCPQCDGTPVFKNTPTDDTPTYGVFVVRIANAITANGVFGMVGMNHRPNLLILLAFCSPCQCAEE
jgi:hypothetical protein